MNWSATAYLSERFLRVSEQSRFPGEQASALDGHSHVGQLELNKVKNTRLLFMKQKDYSKSFITKRTDGT